MSSNIQIGGVKPIFEVTYNGKVITKDITPFILSVDYTDKVIGETDEIEIRIEDTDGRWQDEWYPVKGDRVKLKMGYDDFVLDCGEFEIDDLQCQGPPDIVTIRAVAAWVTSAMRTRDSKAHEKTTLKEIAQDIASKNGLTLVGKILTLRFDRITRYKETDLEFLQRVSNKYGYMFSIRDGKMIFTNIFEIETGLPVYELWNNQLTEKDFKEKLSSNYGAAKATYHNHKTKKIVESVYTAEDLKSKDNLDFSGIVKQAAGGAGGEFIDSSTFKEITNQDAITDIHSKLKADVLSVDSRAENQPQSDAMAKAKLHKKISEGLTGTITTIGTPVFVGGNNIDIFGIGRKSGRYHIVQSKHFIDKTLGYKTTCEIKLIKLTTDPKNRIPKKTEENPVKIFVF